MNAFAIQAPDARADIFHEFATRNKIPAYIAEKDFWVCWLLGRIFATAELGNDCVFKGGTSLSKVFKVIDRFSEDIDLAMSPASLGWRETDLDEAPSNTARQKLMKQIENDCAKAVSGHFLSGLEKAVQSVLGRRKNGGDWLVYNLETISHSPIITFAYPQSVRPGMYISSSVKIEFGSLTDQRPTGTHSIEPFIAELSPKLFKDSKVEVVALEIERTFWEKATILHAEYHRPAAQPLRDRFARHYSDFAALWLHPSGRIAGRLLDLLERVRLHKSRFFASKWANYDTAMTGTLRLLPPDSRLPELRRDYAAMEPMFLSKPTSFDEMLEVLRDAETTLNSPSRKPGLP